MKATNYKNVLPHIKTFIFDVDGDGQLSPDELLDVTCPLE